MKEGFISDQEQKKKDAKWIRLNKMVLVVGLICFNSLFVVYISLLLHAGVGDVESRPKFIKMEIICWAAGLTSSIILICAITYTIIKLRIMFPGQEFSENSRIRCIAIIFCLSIFTKSVFEWAMFYIQ